MSTDTVDLTYITEEQLTAKYADGVPSWRKDAVERFVCDEHKERTILIRDDDLYVHVDTETECK